MSISVNVTPYISLLLNVIHICNINNGPTQFEHETMGEYLQNKNTGNLFAMASFIYF